MGVRSEWWVRCLRVAGAAALSGMLACGSTGLSTGGELGEREDEIASDGGLIPSRPRDAGMSGTAGRRATPPTSGAGAPAAPPRAGVVDAGVRDAGTFIDGASPDGASPDAGRTDATVTVPPPCETGTGRGDIYLDDQEAVEELRGCKSIEGSLFILTQRIEDLSPLRSLQVVTGALHIGATYSSIGDPPAMPGKLRSLAGLEGLRRVGMLELWHLDVANLEPLADLESAEVVRIGFTTALESLAGLGKVVWTSAEISENTALRSLEGLKPPATIIELILEHNEKLETLAGLNGLKNAERIRLSRLPALRSLDGLKDLARVLGGLEIHACDALTDLTGLGTFGDFTMIDGAAALTSLAGVANPGQLRALTLATAPKLTSLAGIDAELALTELNLENMTALTSFAGFPPLTQLHAFQVSGCDALTDLTGLSSVTHIGELFIHASMKVASLRGLDNLESVNVLVLENLGGLTSVQGAPKLKRADGIGLMDLPLLPSLQGLESLQMVGWIDVGENDTLVSLQGLNNVTQTASLNISNNSMLPNLTGLAALSHADSVVIANNVGLASLQGSALATTFNLTVQGNPMLTSLAGLEPLTRAQNLTLATNAGLTSVRALMALSGPSELEVFGNDQLPDCEVEWLAMRVGAMPPPAGANGPAGMCPAP